MSRLAAVFLDAGGVLVWPNWTRISGTLAAHGVDVSCGPQIFIAAIPA